MACTNVTEYLVRETGRYLPGEIYGRMFATSPWVSFTKRGVYPMGLSESINVLTYERTAPISINSSWAAVSVSEGEGGACLPTATTIGFGSTVRSFNLKRFVVQGPDFCAEHFRSVFDLRLQLDRMADILAEYTRLAWEDRDRHEYFRCTGNKVVVDNCGTDAHTDTDAYDGSYPAFQATQTLSLGMLDYWRIRLLRDGAARGTGALFNNGSPVLKVIASQETIGALIRDNSDIREDLRWADSGRADQARLVKALGVNHTYGGFAFFADPYPRRFTYAGGTYTEVAPFSSVAATNDNKSILNPSWLSAPYEESFIFDEDVYHQLVPAPIVNPHPEFRFDPVKYSGDWALKNIPDRTCNPDGNIVFHRGILAAGSMPVHPERGVSLVHLRCNPECAALAVCAS